MRRAGIFLLVVAACGPEAPPMQSDTTTGADSTGAVTSSTSAAPTTGATTSDGSGAGSSTGTMPGTSTTGVTSETSTTSSSSGGESTTGESSTTGEPASCCLAPDEPTSSVQAETPVGAKALPWATFSISGGECGGSVFMYLFPEAASIGTELSDLDGVDYLRIDASTYMDMWPNGFMGTGPVWVEAYFDGQSAMTEGEITILEYVGDVENIYWCDPEVVPVELDAHISFTIALKSDGWDVAGQVLANYCPSLNQICP